MADRIVIMESGRIQQIGTPREVYNAPDNLFVAGFIGSPAMNFLDGEISGGDTTTVRGAGFELPLSTGLAERARRSASRRVTVGLRPEHFAAPEASGRAFDEVLVPVPLEVDVAEYIGSSQFLAARIGATRVTAAVDVGPDTPPMTSGVYGFDRNRLYLFNSETGKSV